MKTQRYIACAVFLSLFTLHPEGFSQTVAQPEIQQPAATGTAAPAPVVNSGTTTATGEEIIQLSPFTVNESKDVGYQAFNTTSANRLNTALRDTAASIQAFTPEFLDDIGASALEDVLNYANNVEGEFDDQDGAMKDDGGRLASNTGARFRLRGIKAQVMQNYARTAIPYDTYNNDRIEIASGPNAILYGMGSPGGVVLYTSNRANARRNTLQIRNRIGTFDDLGSLPQERVNASWNVVLMPNKLGFRLDALYENRNNYRTYTFRDQKRITPALYIKPFKNTTINLNFERGTVKNSVSFNTGGPYDSIQGWLALPEDQRTVDNRNLAGATAGTPAPPGMAWIMSTNQNNLAANVGQSHYVFNENDGTVNDYRQSLISAAADGYKGNAGSTELLPDWLASPNVNLLGPGSQNNQTFQSWYATIEQTIGRVNLEFTYTHNDQKARALTASGQDQRNSGLAADPNLYIAQAGPPTNAIFNSTPRVLNKRAGQLYMEDNWNRSTYRELNDVVHLTAATQFKTGSWGRHIASALLEYAENDRTNLQQDEIWVDGNNVAINSGLVPDDTRNDVWRRRYVTEGDFNDYYAGDGRISTVGFSSGDKAYHSTFVNRPGTANSHTTQKSTSIALVLQSHWFKDSLVTLFGYRLDDIKFYEARKFYDDGTQIRITDPNDPRVVSGQNVLGEAVFDGTDPAYRYHPRTYTASAVWHLPWNIWNRLSLTLNYANNIGPPNLEARVLPDGHTGPTPKGRNFEQGVRIDILGDGNYTLRVTHFDTRQLRDAVYKGQGSNISAESANLGSVDLTNIINTMRRATDFSHGILEDDPLYGTYVPTQDEITNYAFKDVSYNYALADTISQGWEASLTANPTKAITLMANFSYSKTVRTNAASEIFDFFATNGPKWQAYINQLNLSPADKQAYMNQMMASYHDVVNRMTFGSIDNGTDDGEDPTSTSGYWRSASVDPTTGLLTGYQTYADPTGGRRYKFNFRANYKFLKDSTLKGLRLGIGMRYEGVPVIRYDKVNDTSYYGSSRMFFDANIGYKCKIFGGRSDLTIQLNATNIFNSNIVTVARYNNWSDPANPTGIHRLYLAAPRQIFLTTTLNF